MKQHVGGPPVVSGNEESHRERSEDTHISDDYWN